MLRWLVHLYQKKTWGWTDLESASWTEQVKRKDEAHGPAHRGRGRILLRFPLHPGGPDGGNGLPPCAHPLSHRSVDVVVSRATLCHLRQPQFLPDERSERISHCARYCRH